MNEYRELCCPDAARDLNVDETHLEAERHAPVCDTIVWHQHDRRK
jgi:hypothetical protein